MNWKILDYRDKNTYPKESLMSTSIIFYSNITKRMYMGNYNNGVFNYYSVVTSASDKDYLGIGLLGYLKPYEVSCYIEIENIGEINSDIANPTKNGFYIIQKKICNETVNILVSGEFVNTNYLPNTVTVPVIPKWITTTSNEIGKYKWVLVDVTDGLYTFNFYKKHWFWWFHTKHVIETDSFEEGYKQCESLLSKLIL